MKMVHPSQFVATVIEMNKDYCPDFINEMIVSRVSPADFDAMIAELSDHVCGNETNAAGYAIDVMVTLWNRINNIKAL